ncbi:MAG: ATP-grasp domain-containing protein [Gemmatimonadaceae bacterium]|nr:ATP-grasp domain-containing protein [Gemmatimonadaceae bacterium]
MVTVLVTDPEQRAALAAARSLARAGHRVVTIGVQPGLAAASRAVSAHVALPHAAQNEPECLREAVRAAVATHGAQVVLPVTDRASRALLGAHLPGALVAGPTAEAYEVASDKASLMQRAPELGIRVPGQVVLEQLSDLRHALPRGGAWVIKPARSVVEHNGQSLSLSVRFAADWARVTQAVAAYPPAAFPLMIQERVFGQGLGVFLLRREGHTLLSFGHRRLREKPPAGGVSTYREAVAPPTDLVQRCEALLDSLGYEGPAMIEFKEDSATGQPVLMEINARLWGSVQLAIDAGVDFPAALVAATLAQPIPEAPVVRLGTRTYWELGELDHALAIWRKSAEQLAAPPDLRLGARAALRALADRRWADRPEVFRWSDPMPFVVELLRWIRRQ